MHIVLCKPSLYRLCVETCGSKYYWWRADRVAISLSVVASWPMAQPDRDWSAVVLSFPYADRGLKTCFIWSYSVIILFDLRWPLSFWWRVRCYCSGLVTIAVDATSDGKRNAVSVSATPRSGNDIWCMTRAVYTHRFDKWGLYRFLWKVGVTFIPYGFSRSLSRRSIRVSDSLPECVIFVRIVNNREV